MTAYLDKRFTVAGARTVDPRRDCGMLGHWVVQGRRGYECWFCKAPCNVDGTDRTERSA